MTKVAPYAKAITAALVAGLGVLALALQDGEVDPGEWVNIAIAFLTALGAVWAVPNKDPRAEHQEESVQPPHVPRRLDERGESYIGLIIAVLCVVLLVLLILRLP